MGQTQPNGTGLTKVTQRAWTRPDQATGLGRKQSNPKLYTKKRNKWKEKKQELGLPTVHVLCEQ